MKGVLGAAPWAVGLLSGPMTFKNSRMEPGQPWVKMIGKASAWRERTWMNCMSSPSISVMYIGRELSVSSMLRQLYVVPQ